MPAVNLRHIEIFHAVMTTGNLTEAARMPHTSQPTVSRELARFEKVLGLRLFERTRGRLRPDGAGACVCLRRFSAPGMAWTVSSAPPESLREFRQGELSIACLPVFFPSPFSPATVTAVSRSLPGGPAPPPESSPRSRRCWRSGSPPSAMTLA